jgi:hypothetical protein
MNHRNLIAATATAVISTLMIAAPAAAQKNAKEKCLRVGRDSCKNRQKLT